jgi:meckelin
MDGNIESGFNFATPFEFYLGRYTESGDAEGFEPLDDQIVMCPGKNEAEKSWRSFGATYHTQCRWSIGQLTRAKPAGFFDLWMMDGTELQPLPVMIRDVEGNKGSDPAQWRFHRRFFLWHHDDQTGEVKYLMNASLEIELGEAVGDGRHIKTPLLILDYETFKGESKWPGGYEYDTEDSRDFYFSVNYKWDMSGVWRGAIVILIIFLLLAFVLWLFHTIVYVRGHKADPFTSVALIGALCLYLGAALAAVLFVVSFFYFLVTFKWQSSGVAALPAPSEFLQLHVLAWVSLGLLVLGGGIKGWVQCHPDVFLMDWEPSRDPPKAKNPAQPSAWRRLMAGNELIRLSVSRSYSISLTIMAMLLFLLGLKLEQLSSPVPAVLVDTGESYAVLRFAIDTFLWALIILVQGILTFVAWLVIRNPFLNYIDLCATANISVLLRESSGVGYYIHGRSVHAHADDTQAALTENIRSESNNKVGLRGLETGTTEQVFRIFFSEAVAYSIKTSVDGVRQKLSRKALAAAKEANARTNPEVDTMKEFRAVNAYLCRFFEGSSAGDAQIGKFQIRQPTGAEQWLGWAPELTGDSIFTPVDDASYRRMFLSGIQWWLAVTEGMLFAAVDIAVGNVAVAALVTFFFDFAYTYGFSTFFRINVGQDAIYDHHFLLS